MECGEVDGKSSVFQPLPTKAEAEIATGSSVTGSNPQFQQFNILPSGLQDELGSNLIGKPIADIDPFYAKQEVRSAWIWSASLSFF